MADGRRVRVVVTIAAAVAVVAAGVGFLAGMVAVSAVFLGTTVLLVGSLALVDPGDGDPGWPDDGQDVSSDGARREVARLSWAMHGKDSRVETRSARRLHAVAAARLAERGLDLDDPDDEELCVAALGEIGYEALRPDRAHPPFYDEFTAALAAVERLHPTERTPI